MPAYGPYYGPFLSQTAAQIGLCRMADNKYGPDIGVAWQDGNFTQLFRPPVKGKDGTTKMLVVEHLGATPAQPSQTKPAPAGDSKIPGKGTIAWDTFNSLMDVGVVAIATVAFAGAFAAVATAGVTAGAVCLVVFTGIELVNSFALLWEDTRLTIAEYSDRMTGTTANEDALKKSATFNFVETWGPVIALPAIGKDIADFMKFHQIGCDLEELTREMNSRLGVLAREMVLTGDDFILERMKILRQQISDVEEGTEKALDKFKDFVYRAGPADLWATLNDGKNIHDIRDGIEEDFRDWMNDVSGWTPRWMVEAQTRPHYASPIGLAAASHGTSSQMVYKTMNHARFHVITAKPAGKSK